LEVVMFDCALLHDTGLLSLSNSSCHTARCAKHDVWIGKFTEDQYQMTYNEFAFYSLLFFGIISEK
ncbi:hypothetical protein T07_4348, partial [Trichinella nelsoni]